MKKIINKCLLLPAICSLLVTFASCSQNESGAGTDTNTETTLTTDVETTAEVSYLDAELPEMNFNGYNFHFYARNCCPAHNGGLYQESETGDIVNDAVFLRNRTLEEKYNFVISESVLDADGEPTILRNSILANDDIADVAVPHFRFLGTMALENMLVDMGTLPYLDFEREWWYTRLIDDYSIFGRHYVAYGDIGIDNITYDVAIYFNKRIANEYLPDSLYDTVRSGKWTLDSFNENIRRVGSDVDGDGAINPEVDLLSLAMIPGHFFHYQVGADQPTTVRNADNIPELAINTPKMVTIVEKVYNLTHGYEYNNITESASMNWFTEGRVLFTVDILNQATGNAFRDMADDYGLLPFPKYDEAQTLYRTHAGAHTSLLGIPITNSDLERTAFILEAMTYQGWKEVRPALYDIAFKVKNMRDDDSAEMLDIILISRSGDFADIYDEWGLVYTLDNLVGRQKGMDFASYYAKNEQATLNRLNNAIAVFES
jgi:hypothetical protein